MKTYKKGNLRNPRALFLAKMAHQSDNNQKKCLQKVQSWLGVLLQLNMKHHYCFYRSATLQSFLTPVDFLPPQHQIFRER